MITAPQEMRPNVPSFCGNGVLSTFTLRAEVSILRQQWCSHRAPTLMVYMARPNASRRGYDARWQQARAAFLRNRPRCDMCGARAQHVHHKEPHKGDPKVFWNKSLWQPLCDGCHNRWAQQVECVGYHSNVDPSGVPSDPNHPFNKPRGSTPGEVKSPSAKGSRPPEGVRAELVDLSAASPRAR
jgi:hypothetical protein